jgi:hypothetical protein
MSYQTQTDFTREKMLKVEEELRAYFEHPLSDPKKERELMEEVKFAQQEFVAQFE